MVEWLLTEEVYVHYDDEVTRTRYCFVLGRTH